MTGKAEGRGVEVSTWSDVADTRLGIALRFDVDSMCLLLAGISHASATAPTYSASRKTPAGPPRRHLAYRLARNVFSGDRVSVIKEIECCVVEDMSGTRGMEVIDDVQHNEHVRK